MFRMKNSLKINFLSTLANVLSCILIASSGIIINLILGKFYDTEVVGAFNQVASYYIIMSHFGGIGIHYSILHKIAILDLGKREAVEIKKILWAALLGASIISSFFTIVGYSVLWILESYTVISSQIFIAGLWILPALPFYTFNRVLLNAVNASKDLNGYAFFALGRHVLLILNLSLFIFFNVSPYRFTCIFSISELILFFLFVFYLRIYKIKASVFKGIKKVIQQHFSFGLKALLNGVVSELNTKVDIIILSLFSDISTVGIYSLVANIYEGLLQICFAIRNITNPHIAINLFKNKKNELRKYLHKIMSVTSVGILFFCIAVIFSYPEICIIILNDKIYLKGYSSLIILLSSLAFSSGFLIIDMIFIQAGMPSLQSYLKLSSFVINIIINLLLVPALGMAGAAIGTAFSLIFSVFLQEFFIRRYLLFNLFPSRKMVNKK